MNSLELFYVYRGTDNEDVIYIYNDIYIYQNTAIKKNEIMPFATTWMDLEIIILSEVSQIEKDQYFISLISGIFKKIQMNLFTKQK